MKVVLLPVFTISNIVLLPSSTQSWIQPKPFEQRFKRPPTSSFVASRFSKAPAPAAVENVTPMPLQLSARPLGDMLRTSSKILKVEQVTNFFKLSPKTQIHAASFAFFMASVGLLSVEPVARLVLDVLSMLPCASWTALKFDPVGALNWVVHSVLLVTSLELPYGFFLLMSKSDSIHKKRIYNGFFAAYVVAYFQSFFTMLSHVFIAHNTPLEEMLDILFKVCLQTFIFGTGVSVQWGAWALVPTFVGINMGVVGYGNWVGRALSLFSIYKHFIPEIPPLFRYSYLSLVFIPVFTKILLKTPGAQYTDLTHTLVALIIAMSGSAMAFSLNRKVKFGDE